MMFWKWQLHGWKGTGGRSEVGGDRDTLCLECGDGYVAIHLSDL